MRDGNGNYQLPASNPVTTGTTISSTDFNSTMADIASAMTQSLSKDGQTTPTSNLPMGGNRHTGVGDATLPNQYATAKQLQNGSSTTAGSVSNVVDAFAASILPAIANYSDGMAISFTPSVTTTTTSPTLALNGLGAKPIQKEANVACAAGDIVVNVPAYVLYVAQGAGYFLLLNPQVITGARVKGIPDGSLSANVALLSVNNSFTGQNGFTAPASGSAIIAGNAGGQFTVQVGSDGPPGSSNGMFIRAGTTSADNALVVVSKDSSRTMFQVAGNGSFGFSGAGSVGGGLIAANFVANTSSGVPNILLNAAAGGTSYSRFSVAGATHGDVGTGLFPGSADLDLDAAPGKNINLGVSGTSVWCQMTPTGAWRIYDGVNQLFDAGFRDIPLQNVSSYTLTLGDRGKGIVAIIIGGAITIPANSAVPFPIGSTVVIDNQSGGNITIAIGTGDTLSQVGTGTTGPRTLGNAGQAFLWKTSTQLWRIGGVNLT